MALIEVTSVSKRFQRSQGRKLLLQRVKDLFQPSAPQSAFYAVRDVTFQIAKGESVALLGANGAGKSTLLSLVAGLARPDAGTVIVNGRIAALLDLGSGFHPDLTGEENIFMNAALLGLSERDARARFAQIVEFSELSKFVHEPVRTYSNGMVLRLAFSVAVHADPAVLIVDEVLGVGDGHFQEKSANKVAELGKQGVTMLCVSHSAKMITDFCSRAIWIHQGEIVSDGPAKTVALDYSEFAANPSKGRPQSNRTTNSV